MQNNIGTIIKLKRIENKISQKDLCNGICSPSYLSRIENNQLIANGEIYKLLCERLGIEYKNHINQLLNINKRIENWYYKLLRNKVFSKEEIKELKLLSFSSSNEASIKFKIIYCRYLLINNQIDDVKESLINVSKVIEKGNNRNFFIYSNVLLLFFLKQGKYKNAIDAGIRLTNIKGYESLGNDYELGIFYYNLALAYQNIYSYHEAKYYAQKALDIFNENYDLEQALDCLVLLGICYNNIKEWDQVYKISALAKKILDKYMPNEFTKRYLGMIENNLGNCFEYQNKYSEAINYYLKSLKYLDKEQQIVPIINIIRCYYYLKDIHSSRFWLNNALKRERQISEKCLIQLEIFSVILNEQFEIDNIYNIQNTSIKYFFSHNLWELAISYCKLFASIYESLNYHKRASQMYKLALQANEKIMKG